MNTVKCPACGGRGGLLYGPGLIIDICGKCHGTGQVKDSKVSEEKKDWRIGLTVRAKFSTHRYYYERGEVIDVLPSGTGGINDLNGVLVLKLSGGATILEPSESWVTA